jgi:hypothetical protein
MFFNDSAPVCFWWALLAVLLHELGDEAGPTCLMTGADAGAIVAMKIFVKLD